MKLKDAFLRVKTPAYLIDAGLLVKNLEILKIIAEESGAKILLAQKAFSMFSLYPLIGKYLSGTTASGLFEARLGFEEMGKENHIFSPAYQEDTFDEILEICDHLVFNSFNQWERFKKKALAKKRSCGLRVNPECSTQAHSIYDPCAPGSRLGVTLENLKPLDGIEGLHFHTLCEQNVDALLKTWEAFEDKFGKYLEQMKWINLGGGHHITRDDYESKALIELIKRIRGKYKLKVYLEPGEAVALNAGFLVTKIVDIVDNGIKIAILDASAACHMPDVIEMPYRPPLLNENRSGEYSYRLAGPSCLAGDIIGDYFFDHRLLIGDTLVFSDMAIYTMVKNNTFNGIPLPGIILRDLNEKLQIIREFGYLDFKNRLS